MRLPGNNGFEKQSAPLAKRLSLQSTKTQPNDSAKKFEGFHLKEPT
jgi:hypothetical protein